jgi:hypothetical protein
MGIYASGEITGEYSTAAGWSHGFFRAKDGTIITFDPPGSSEPDAYTFALGVNPSGVIAGWYIDPQFLRYGFLRIRH